MSDLADPLVASPSTQVPRVDRPDPREHAPRSRAETALWVIAIAIGTAYVVAYVAQAFARIDYPYELEWLEQGVMEHVAQVLHGHSLYGPPDRDFVPFPYPPLYYYACAPFAALFGNEFSTLRAVSFAASLATFAVIGRLVARETSSRAAGALAVGLYAACFGLGGYWYDLARVDSFFVLLLIGGVYVLRFGEGRRSAVCAGLLMCAAAFTKQTALLIAVPLGLYLLATRRARTGLWYLGAFLVPFGTITLGLIASTHGWYQYWIFDLLRQHAKDPGALHRFFSEDLAAVAIATGLTALGLVRRFGSGDRWTAGFWTVAIATSMAACYSSRQHTGGYLNVLMPMYLFLSIGLAIGVASMWHPARRPAPPGAPAREPSARRALLVGRIGVLGLAVLQLVLLAYDPTTTLPQQSDRAAGDRFMAWLRSQPGDVLVVSHPHYAVMAGKASQAGQGSIIDVLRGTDEQPKQILRRSFADAVHQRRYAAIVIDSPADLFVLPSDLTDYYRPQRLDVFPTQDGFLPVDSLRTRPTIAYLPRS